MSRLLTGLGLCVTLAVAVVGIWMLLRPPLALLILPNATDVQIARLHWNEWQITYRASNATTPWPSAIGEHLKASNWVAEGASEYGALSRTYVHSSRIGVGELWEWAFLTVDPLRPDVVEIRLRRWIHLPWLRAGFGLPSATQ